MTTEPIFLIFEVLLPEAWGGILLENCKYFFDTKTYIS